jgi:hypothetical protein
MIFLELTGKVFVYSNPRPSALNKARGRSSTKSPPIEAAINTTVVLSNSKLEIIRVINTVSSAGRAKKKAVAGFLEAIFTSLKT